MPRLDSMRLIDTRADEKFGRHRPVPFQITWLYDQTIMRQEIRDNSSSCSVCQRRSNTFSSASVA